MIQIDNPAALPEPGKFREVREPIIEAHILVPQGHLGKKVPGQLDPSWAEWAEGLTISIVDERDGWPVSTLSLTIDQAGLTKTLLRRLYALGLPLISVTWVE